MGCKTWRSIFYSSKKNVGKSKKFTYFHHHNYFHYHNYHFFQGYVKTMKSILYMINKLLKELQELKIKLKNKFFNNSFLNPYCSFFYNQPKSNAGGGLEKMQTKTSRGDVCSVLKSSFVLVTIAMNVTVCAFITMGSKNKTTRLQLLADCDITIPLPISNDRGTHQKIPKNIGALNYDRSYFLT